MNGLRDTIRFRFFRRVNTDILRGVIKLLGPRICAYLSYWTIDSSGLKSGAKNIACLYRESFIKDIEALRRYGRFNYVVVTSGFTRFQQAWLPRELTEQTFYQQHTAQHPEALQKCRIYAETLYRLMDRKFGVDGFLTGNFDYWQDHPFKEVAKEKKVPFLVLSREHPIIPAVCDIVKDRYARAEYRFTGNAIAVAGQSTFDVITHSGTICNESQVRITGLPRYDAWRPVVKDKSISDRRYITLLTFTTGYFADATFGDVLACFVRAAEMHRSSGISFVVKTKDRIDTEKVRELLQGCQGADDVVVSDEINLFDLLPDSRLIIGYNSLSMVEGLMSGARIATPGWGQCLTTGPKVMYPEDDPLIKEMVEFAKSEDELNIAIRRAVDNTDFKVDRHRANRLIQQYIYIPETNTSADELESLFLDCEQEIA